MGDKTTLTVRHLDTGETAELHRFDPHRLEHILVQRPNVDQLDSVFVLDWEPVEGTRQDMYLFLSEKED